MPFVIAFHRSVDSLPKFPHLVLWLGLVSSPDPFKCVHVEEGSGENRRVLVTAARMLAAQIRLLFHILFRHMRFGVEEVSEAVSRAVKLGYGSGRC